jgi:hypothetical protein
LPGPAHVRAALAGGMPGWQITLIAAERHAALCQALACLPPDGQRLLALLIANPPVPCATISAELGIPVGSIGPTRARCLDKLRRHPAIAALIHAPAENLEREPRPQSNPEKRCLRLPVQSSRRAIRVG